MRNLVVLLVVAAICVVGLTGCGALCGGEPALQLRSPLSFETLAPQNTLPRGNVAVYSASVAPVQAMVVPMATTYSNACPAPAPVPVDPLFGVKGYTREK